MPYINDMAFLGAEISDNLAETQEGFLLCLNVPIARTGIQEYLGQEIGLKPDHPDYSRVVKVYRLAEDVMAEEALRSFEGKPFTDDHPSETVTPVNYGMYDRGHLQNVRSNGEHVVADVMAKENNIIQMIRNKQKRQVSAGYFCDYVKYKDGYRQINIRGNHLALVTRGRAGPKVCIRDSVTRNNGANRKMALTKKQAQAKVLMALAQSVTDADELAELTELLALDGVASTVVSEPAKAPDKKPENGLLKALMGSLFSKDEDGDEDKKKADDEDEEGDKDKKTEDSLSKRMTKIETTLDSLLKAIQGKAQDSDDDEDEDDKEKTDDEDEDTEEEKKAAADAAMKDMLSTMKPYLAKLPEKARKEAKDAIRRKFGQESSSGTYLSIAKISEKKQAQDSDPTDWSAFASNIAAQFNPHVAKK